MTTSLASKPTTDSATLPLEPLFELQPGAELELRGRGMPTELRQRYGGELAVPLRADRPTVVANFVSTIDGVVAFGDGELSGGGLVSGFYEPDRFVMGLLRALADVVVIGAGTLRGSTDHRWTPAHVHPRSASAFAEWRRAMGLADQPTTVVVSASGNLPVDHAGLNDPRVPVVIATTPSGAELLERAAPGEQVSVKPIGDGSLLSGSDVIGVAASLGARLILTEGGPHLMGELVASDLLDELFLTVSPQLVGRGEAQRLGLVEGVALPPADARWQQLASVRRSADHLFLRYRRLGDRPKSQES